MRFELKDRDGLARRCELTTPHGKLETPALLPVVNPNLSEVSPAALRDEFGFRAVITNAYIIRRSEGLAERALKEGVHRLLGFDGPIMTDSGTFQMRMYRDAEVTNAEIVSFQLAAGSDIATPLDLFTEPGEPLGKAESDWAETLGRYLEALALPNPKGALLALTVQGGSHLAVRRRAAGDLSALPAAVHPIGGVVPIMEGERYSLLADVIATAKAALPRGRPVHLFGAGHPLVIPLAVWLGCDLFDSSSYAKYAHDGRLLYPDGTRALADLEENPCPCPVCARHTPADLRALPPPERYLALARHNLHVLSAEMRKARQAIREGSVFELVESRARANPRLLEAVRRVALHADLLEEVEPASRTRALRYFDATSGVLPTVELARRRLLERAPLGEGEEAVLVAARGTPFSKRLPQGLAKLRRDAHVPLFFETLFGPVPEALEEVYPFAQHIAPQTLDAESASRVARATESYARRWPQGRLRRFEEAELGALRGAFRAPPLTQSARALAQVEATLAYQFGAGAASLLRGRAATIERSPRTGKVRTVWLDGRHVLSLRAHDGLFSLTFEGGGLLAKAVPAPRHRVAVVDDTAPFNAQGKNVFAPFVKSCDPDLRPGDEALVADEAGAIVAVGRMRLAPGEINSFGSGVAVDVRQGARSRRVPP
ncbi:MAG TPA: tRNA guanosine(15) transglycosylase TgtA [Candidatus Thermoplasmatota archaeon]|nr:tRNA guanosine(15) transglycosylase TgtA [Candidatus Thermoplasmatota archaeon]